jgi:hypothetical protein
MASTSTRTPWAGGGSFHSRGVRVRLGPRLGGRPAAKAIGSRDRSRSRLVITNCTSTRLSRKIQVTRRSTKSSKSSAKFKARRPAARRPARPAERPQAQLPGLRQEPQQAQLRGPQLVPPQAQLPGLRQAPQLEQLPELLPARPAARLAVARYRSVRRSGTIAPATKTMTSGTLSSPASRLVSQRRRR